MAVGMDEANAGLHQLVLLHGRERARELVPVKQRALVDIAAEVMAAETERLGISYTGFCLTSLPHKKLPDTETWERLGHNVRLWVEPGKMHLGDRTVTYGVPYGARARMILIYLQTQAVRSQSREIELGRSMRDWMDRMGLAVGGETAKSLKDQSARISACTLKFFWHNEQAKAKGFTRAAIVTSGFSFCADNTKQDSLWEERVVLDEAFFRALKDHPVPFLENAIKQLRERSMSIDVYIWLAYRLHELDKPVPISWLGLYEQFGAGFTMLKNFKLKFVPAIAASLAAYPEARVDITEAGITLHPSRAPHARIAALVT